MDRASRHRALAVSLLAVLAGVLSGCASILPSSESATKSAWPTFAEVKQAYDRLEPQVAVVEDLKREKFHPGVNPQVATLPQTEVLRRFYISNMPSEFIDKGVYACLAAHGKCEVYEIEIRQMNKQRVGNPALDVTTFKRDTEIRGWRFTAVFLVNNGVLVYKTWGGQAEVAERENVTNPLGPVQTITPQLFGL
ncbi:MAG: hypothetical protein QM776_16075 [Rhodocyclaceae bacterium]